MSTTLDISSKKCEKHIGRRMKEEKMDLDWLPSALGDKEKKGSPN